MRPVPLRGPGKVVYGYACGRCRALGLHGGFATGGRKTPRPFKWQVENSRRAAERCCTCNECHRESAAFPCRPCQRFRDWTNAWYTIGLQIDEDTPF